MAMDDANEWICKRVALRSAKAVEATEPVEAAEQASSQNYPAEAPVAESEAHRSGVGPTFITRGAEFEGTLRLRESFRIDCEFRGAILSEGSVVVAKAAGIKGSVHAREVVIAGTVVGDVKARQVIIRAGGRLDGDVETPCLEVEKGAFFNGRTAMFRPEVTPRAAAGASVAPESSGDSTALPPRSAFSSS